MKLLYHASTFTKLRVIKPHQTLYKNGRPMGKFVFASYNVKYAAMYLVRNGNYTLMNAKGKKPYIIIRANQKHYLENDQPGAIYTLSDKTFIKTPQQGLEKTERVSNESVEVIDKRIFSSSIEGMIEMGITIYFVNRKTFKLLLDTKDDKKILPQLTPYLVVKAKN
jgi:hypothetical protein